MNQTLMKSTVTVAFAHQHLERDPSGLVVSPAGSPLIVTGPAAVDSSLTVKRDTIATRQQVWDVVADGWTYSQWVVGNSRMRAVEPDWPAVGSKIHHTIGIWPRDHQR